MLADPFASKVLDKTVHARLVADLENYAHDARIQPSHIWTPLAAHCGPAEVEYVTRFRFHRGEDVAGLCYLGDPTGEVDVGARMSAIAGALVRNFVRARVVTLTELFDDVEDGGITDISALLIPNFHVQSKLTRANWKTANILDVMLYRRTLGVQTIVYVADLDAATQEYGVAVGRILRQNYVHIEL